MCDVWTGQGRGWAVLVPQGSDKRGDVLSTGDRCIVWLVRQGWDKKSDARIVVKRSKGKLLLTVVLCREISIFVSRTPFAWGEAKAELAGKCALEE